MSPPTEMWCQECGRNLGHKPDCSVVLWYRPDLAWVMVLGWCGAGVWIGALNYRAAMMVVAIAARRKAEIVVTEVKP